MSHPRQVAALKLTKHEFPKTRDLPQHEILKTILQLAFFVARPPPLSGQEAPTLSAGRFRCQRSRATRAATPIGSPQRLREWKQAALTIGNGCRFFILEFTLAFAFSCSFHNRYHLMYGSGNLFCTNFLTKKVTVLPVTPSVTLSTFCAISRF